MATLYQIGNDGTYAARWEIGSDPVLVGRSREARVSLKDDGLSRRHFLILREGPDYVVRDLNSRNGTWVDGYRVVAWKLHHNDSIQAGRTVFVFADRASESIAVRQAPAGPHGTVVLPAEPLTGRGSAEAAPCSSAVSFQILRAAA